MCIASIHQPASTIYFVFKVFKLWWWWWCDRGHKHLAAATVRRSSDTTLKLACAFKIGEIASFNYLFRCCVMDPPRRQQNHKRVRFGCKKFHKRECIDKTKNRRIVEYFLCWGFSDEQIYVLAASNSIFIFTIYSSDCDIFQA